MQGVVSAGSQLTAEAGVEILRSGGNAVDAAVGAAFASFIAEASVVHLGGSGIALVFEPESGETAVYDFFSDAPGLGARKSSKPIDFEEVIVDFGDAQQSFYVGRGASAVGGNIAGLCEMLEERGTLSRTRVLGPALRLAQNGLPLELFQAETAAMLRPIFTHTSEISRIFAPEGRPLTEGDRFFVPHLAETLDALASEGPEIMRTGSLATAILEDQASNGGLITAQDLRSYGVCKPRPIEIGYRGFRVLLPPPSSSGGLLTAFSLALLSGIPLEGGPLENNLRVVLEVLKETLLTRPIIDQLKKDPSADWPAFFSSGVTAKHRDALLRRIRGNSHAVDLEKPSNLGATSHISVVDGDGRGVALTTSAGESAGYVVPGTGLIANNIMGESDLHPEGFHQTAPGTRVSTMMTPTIVLEGDKLRWVLGSGGSTRIRSALLQVLARLIDHGQDLDSAVEAARFHYEDALVQCEYGVDPAATDDLEKQGYRVRRWTKRSLYFGGAHCAGVTLDGELSGAADSRRAGVTLFA